ncbi:hypothetical protein [Streptomyces chromofuscus]|uniref:Uncharacterized protein n=1 Tax=Streptomyces chromofuscus TaxID=42881 RepID=A0A7M2TGG4_STRCW|nr:hypothetical protein [Streptomyces chromofuscus]QOV46361.1 hypothetical protein IPT68_10895 [Streptomyces chromofuscus]GGS95008.1 hypothetical protein GCM10010254_13700 [Streptomyces chromofuscus]
MPLPSAYDVALAAERRAAARLLLAHPLVTSTGPHRDMTADDLTLVVERDSAASVDAAEEASA